MRRSNRALVLGTLLAAAATAATAAAQAPLDPAASGSPAAGSAASSSPASRPAAAGSPASSAAASRSAAPRPAETRPAAGRNRLGLEKSAYLRAHAEQPVHWYAWGEEAFAAARRENKPIFFSSGYASCHWCHVMARESFANAEIAAFLNEHFICVKLDREERPDIDRVYLEACVQLTGTGGWPLTAFLTPERRPFYLATYLPPDDRGEEPGFLSICRAVVKLWRDRAAELDEAGASFVEGFSLRHLPTSDLEALVRDLERRSFASVLAAASRPADSRETADEDADAWRVRVVRARDELERRRAAPVAGPSLLEAAAKRLRDLEDPEAGGFGLQPKFPATTNLSVLLRAGARSAAGAAGAAGTTAPGAAGGGSNANNPSGTGGTGGTGGAGAASNPAAAGGGEERAVVERQLRGMLRGALRDRLAGGWHRYAVDRHWLEPHYEKMLYDQALIAVAYLEAWQLGRELAYAATVRETLDFLRRAMRVPGGGFASAFDAESNGEEGAYYLWSRADLRATLDPASFAVVALWAGFEGDGVEEDRRASLGERVALDDVAGVLKLELPAARAALAAGLAKLATARAVRPAPKRIEAVITGWNALAVSAFARAALAFQDPELLAEAESALATIDRLLLSKDGLYRRRAVEGEAAFAGELADQAYVLLALLDLHEATLDRAYLGRAQALAAKIVAAYGAADGGLYDSTAADLPWRTREATDDAWPSGAGAALQGFVRLALMTAAEDDRTRAERLAAYLKPRAADSPADHGTVVVALDLLEGKSARVEIHGDAVVGRMLAAEVRGRFLPFTVVVRAIDETPVERPHAVVCIGKTCLEPAYDAAALNAALDSAFR
jgi:uncharacterized protein YyaL (SSP411 family)